jgi:hypothetical protein
VIVLGRKSLFLCRLCASEKVLKREAKRYIIIYNVCFMPQRYEKSEELRVLN